MDVEAAAPKLGVCVCCDCSLGSCGRRGFVACAHFGLVSLMNWAAMFGFRSGFRYKLDTLGMLGTLSNIFM